MYTTMEKSHIQRNIHFNFDPAKEMQSPRFRAILRATSGRRKRHSADVKSFSHELNSKGLHHLPIQKLRGLSSPEDVTSVIYSKFSRLKQEVNSELSVYAGDLVNILDKTKDDHPEWKVPLEDLLVIAQKCSEMTPDEFWSKCEGIVQDLDDRRQDIPMGTVKQAHTRILFILTRCTRLLQFQKENAYSENDNHVLSKHQFSDLGFYPEQITNDGSQKLKSTLSAQAIKDKLIRKKLQEHGLSTTYLNHYTSETDSPCSRDRISSWKKLPSAAEKNHPKKSEEESPPNKVLDSLPHFDKRKDTYTDIETVIGTEEHISKMICRVCDFEIPTLHAEGHFKICSIADRCDSKGLNVNERLEKVSEVLEKILECEGPTDDGLNMAVSSAKSVQSLDFCEIKQLPDCMTPTSPLPTPHTWHLDLLLTVKHAYSGLENFEQVSSLLKIVRSIADIETCDYNTLESLSSYLEELSAVIDNRKVDALIVETFGRRIVKLLREKFIHLCGQIDDENKESPCVDGDEDISVENGSSHSSHPLNTKLKDRTSIEDFEIIKPISRGAFGRVFLAKKRVTGDLFAIKVLKKADMIRKNAVESILAERNILISVRNPFVVRFYYSFTCRENLYLVMEYLNGGDLYSLLRNLGCLEEDMARTYIAELVLALEYLHSMNIIHRDLKPDNLLIARDGHIKLTDFGLSKVGLINSTDDLTGPDVSSAVIFDDHKPMPASIRAEIREQRQKQTAVGTPDYLAPEILLGMAHGQTADWWSVGVILFELLVGIPPFNAEHPQKIFDNIMNRDIPWPQVPEEISYDAYDLINKLLIQNPFQRLGATGAAEVKAHPFFKSISWDMLAEKKAAFIPSTESEDDTSYFSCRHAWNLDDAQIRVSPDDFDDTTDTGSMSCSSSPYSYDDDEDEDEDECGSMEEFGVPKKYSFSNFSFKNISQLASMNYDIISKTSEDEANATNA